MIEIEVNKNNLLKFIKNIRKEDEQELISAFGKKYKKEFIRIVLGDNDNSNTYFLADKENNPVAIGGVVEFYKNKNIRIGQVWLLCSKSVLLHKLFLYKYIKNKILSFKKEFDILFNYIFKSNFEALKWLKKSDFIEIDTSSEDYKMFYFDKGEKNFDIRNITC